MLATAHKIYPDEPTARAICALLNKGGGEPWEVVKVSIGHQVKRPGDVLYTSAMDAPIKFNVDSALSASLDTAAAKLKAGLDKAKAEKSAKEAQSVWPEGKPLKKPGSISDTSIPPDVTQSPAMSGSMKSGQPSSQQAPKTKAAKVVIEQQVYVELEYVKQSPMFLEVKLNGKITWVQKGCITQFDVFEHPKKVVVMKMPVSYAKKRAFPFAYKPEPAGA